LNHHDRIDRFLLAPIDQLVTATTLEIYRRLG